MGPPLTEYTQAHRLAWVLDSAAARGTGETFANVIPAKT